MADKYMFHNFTDKEFVGMWNKIQYRFKPGAQHCYSKGIAEHFAKHLTNQILNDENKSQYCSPKKPEQVPEFMNIFKKCFIVVEGDEDNLDIPGDPASLEEPSMNVKMKKAEPIDPYDASKPSLDSAPSAKGQIVENDDDEGYEEEEPVEEPVEEPKKRGRKTKK